MKHISMRFGTVLILFILLILSLVVLTQVSAEPLVTTGQAPWDGEMIGLRWRSLANTGGEEVYVGISNPRGGGLGNAVNRTALNMTWQATNQVAYIFDRANDIMTATMSNGSGTYTRNYPNVSTQLTARGIVTWTLNDLSMLQITVVNRDYSRVPSAGVVFQNVHLDGYPLGTFGDENVGQWQYWTVSRHSLNQGFVLTGTLVLTGTFNTSQESCKVEVSVGAAKLGNIGGTVWFDQNADATQNAGEPGLAGILVGLDNLARLDYTTTDANGVYLFPNLFLTQTYTTTLGAFALPPGTMYSTAWQYVNALTFASPDALSDHFGLYGPGSIGDWVWYDANGDGVQDPGELGLSYVVVNLTSGSGLNVSTTTDPNGYYTFTNLLLDEYYTVTASLNPLYYPTTPAQYRYLDTSNTAPRDVDLGYDSNLGGIDAQKMRLNGRCCAAWDLYYYIVITNNMASPMTFSTVKDMLPPEIAPYSVQTGFGPPSARVPGGTFDGVNMVVWNIASIAPGSSQWMWVKARTWSTAAGRTMVNRAWVAHNQLDVPIPLQETSVIEACFAPPPPTPTPTPTPPPAPPGTTVVIKRGGPGTSLDTYIYRNQPYSNYWLEPLLKVGYKQTNAALIQFDLSPIPAGAKVDEAWLEVWAAGWSGAYSDITIGAYAISETVQISQTTWVSPELGATWTLSGANDVLFDRRPVPESTVTTSGPLKWYRFDVATLVQEWLDGMPNNGALLRCESCAARKIYAGPPDGTSAVVEEGADAELGPSNGALPGPLPGNLCPYTYFFASSENANMALWPRLVVRYE